MKLYHYTDEKGAKAIQASGKIKASKLTPQDAFYGEGVYLTSLGPENSTEKLVGNNWDDRTPSPALMRQMEARTEWVVEVPKGKAVRVSRNRDVYLHKGDLYLDGNCKIYRRSNPDEYWWCVLL